jgi:hypothetical protein
MRQRQALRRIAAAACRQNFSQMAAFASRRRFHFAD